MSKLAKTVFVWFVIFIVSTLIGATIFMTSSGFIEYNAGNLETIEINDVQVLLENLTKDIEINSLSTDIEIIKTNSSSIKIELTGFYVNNSYNDIPRLKIEESSEEIGIEIEYPKRNLVLGMARNKLNLKIFVPENYNKNFDIKTASGEVFGKDLKFNELNIITISGDISLENIYSVISKISSTSGDIKTNSMISENLDLFSISGNIYLENTTPNKVKTTSGDIYINSNIDRNLELKSVSGNIKITSFENSNFKVNFNSVSGDFDGNESLGGKYLVSVKTTSGDLRVY